MKRRFVVFTGGEPLLQLHTPLIEEMKRLHFHIAVESNGTMICPSGVDWLCVSPKAGSNVIQRDGNELKLVYPQTGLSPDDVADWDFERFYLQPMDSELREQNTRAAIQYCLDHPQWRLSLQTHKMIGMP
jgi:organic radical activating enzyme